MGTRGAIGFRLDGQDKVTYNHFDSYPSGVGAELLTELCGIKNWEAVKTAVRNITFIDQNEPPTEEQIELCAEFTDLGVGDQSTSDWYCLLRGAQGSLAPYLTGKLPFMSDNHTFLLASVFCEYAYIVNLDDMTLEFYKGFNKDNKLAGRYASKSKAKGQGRLPTEEYFGVVLMEAMPLADLPKTKRGKGFVIKTVKRWDDLCHDPEDDE
jgi:hypothetical protein